MFKIELFVWHNTGLVLTRYKKNSAREAMDFAYSKPWNVLKVYDENGVLMHLNSSNKEYETYA